MQLPSAYVSDRRFLLLSLFFIFAWPAAAGSALARNLCDVDAGSSQTNLSVKWLKWTVRSTSHIAGRHISAGRASSADGSAFNPVRSRYFPILSSDDRCVLGLWQCAV